MGPSKLNDIKIGYSFDDLFILPAVSAVEPNASKVDSRLTKDIELKIPLVSSPMDTVTESVLAIALAESGAIGAIHRNMSVEREVDEVKKVKERLGNESSTVDGENRLRVIAAIGPFDVGRAKALDLSGADVILVDCAHGHNLNVIESVKRIKKEIGCEIIVGNIATKEAVESYLSVEPDAFRVGLASGSICSTKTATGIGVPQASAVHEVYLKLKDYGIPMISDGGIKTGGDIVKALALGADSVMIGSLFAGTLEAPGEILDGSLFGLSGKYKLYRGMGSKSVIKDTDRYMKLQKYASEGMEAIVPYRGSAKDLLEELACSIEQGMGYIGARNIMELGEKVKFVYVPGRQRASDVIPIDTEKWLKLKKKV